MTRGSMCLDPMEDGSTVDMLPFLVVSGWGVCQAAMELFWGDQSENLEMPRLSFHLSFKTCPLNMRGGPASFMYVFIYPWNRRIHHNGVL